jgi:hypothetical protein
LEAKEKALHHKQTAKAKILRKLKETTRRNTATAKAQRKTSATFRNSKLSFCTFK